MRRLLALLALTAGLLPAAAGQAATPVLSRTSPSLAWQGSVPGLAPLDCSNPNTGCDERDLVVQAAKGAWVTVAVAEEGMTLRVTHGPDHVASAGGSFAPNPSNTSRASTTFQQVASGKVTYHVLVGTLGASSDGPIRYHGTARLAGRAFDRAGDCGVTPGIAHLQDADDGRLLRLSVRLVSEPGDAAATRQAGRTVVETYRRIGVVVRVSYDSVVLRGSDDVAYRQVRARYGGVRPPGVDVVHVLTDRFPGGVADCIGGVMYAEKAFSVGNVHYTVQGTAPVDRVPAGMVAAHEIGHLLGAEHQQVSCAEALPQQALKPASDGWTGPCTVMSPAALAASETFSTLERSTIRAFVRRYARG